MSEKGKEENRIKPGEKSASKSTKLQLKAKKDIKISGPAGKIVIKKGDDCSKYLGSVKQKLIENNVI